MSKEVRYQLWLDFLGWNRNTGLSSVPMKVMVDLQLRVMGDDKLWSRVMEIFRGMNVEPSQAKNHENVFWLMCGKLSGYCDERYKEGLAAGKYKVPVEGE